MLIASARTWTLADSTPARTSSNSASGAHSAVANVSLTPFVPPQVTELISVSQSGSPARSLMCSTVNAVRPMLTVAFSLSTRAIVGNVREPGFAQAS